MGSYVSPACFRYDRQVETANSPDDNHVEYKTICWEGKILSTVCDSPPPNTIQALPPVWTKASDPYNCATSSRQTSGQSHGLWKAEAIYFRWNENHFRESSFSASARRKIIPPRCYLRLAATSFETESSLQWTRSKCFFAPMLWVWTRFGKFWTMCSCTYQ